MWGDVERLRTADGSPRLLLRAYEFVELGVAAVLL